MPKLADALRRGRSGESQTALAKRLGVHKNSLAMYERGERLPDVDFLAAFAAHTGVPFGELLQLRLHESEVPEARTLANAVRDTYKIEAAQGRAVQSYEIDQELLADVIEILEEELRARNQAMSAEKKAVVISEIYTLMRESEAGEHRSMSDFASLIRSMIRVAG